MRLFGPHIIGIVSRVCLASSLSAQLLMLLYVVGGVVPSSMSWMVQALRCSAVFGMYMFSSLMVSPPVFRLVFCLRVGPRFRLLCRGCAGGFWWFWLVVLWFALVLFLSLSFTYHIL